MRSDHGREVWQLHFHADVTAVDSMSEMTRVQKITLQRLQAHWSEKTKQKHSRDMPSGVPSSL